MVALRGTVPPLWKLQYVDSIEDVKAFARRRNPRIGGGGVTKQNLVGVQYKAQLRDIMGELQAVRARRARRLRAARGRTDTSGPRAR